MKMKVLVLCLWTSLPKSSRMVCFRMSLLNAFSSSIYSGMLRVYFVFLLKVMDETVSNTVVDYLVKPLSHARHH